MTHTELLTGLKEIFGTVEANLETMATEAGSDPECDCPAANNSHSPYSDLTITSNAIELDFTTTGVFSLTLTANVIAVTISNLTVDEANFFTLLIKQDSTGGRTFTNPSSWKFSGGTYVASTGANKADLVQGVTYDDGTTWMVSFLKDYV